MNNNELDAHIAQKWPPLEGKYVYIKNNQGEIFIGKVLENISYATGTIILLINKRDYVDPTISRHKINSYDGKGLYFLLSSHNWKYINESELDNMEYIDEVNSIYNSLKNNAEKDKNAIIAKKAGCQIDDNFKDTSLLDEKKELNYNNLFIDREIKNEDSEVFIKPKLWVMRIIMEKLKNPEIISNEEQKIIVNKTIAVNNIIETKEDEVNEGEKIIHWLNKNLINIKTDGIRLFSGFKMRIHNGYVHIWRSGINVNDKITAELVPELNYFKWQYGIPIHYESLKYVLFQNKFQKMLRDEALEQKEAEKILSQEYLICLQPQPKYQMWCVKRLIMAWYSDVVLQNNVRKFKILINQWRGRDDQEFNKKHGVLPSIVVYPKYGKKSSRIVLSKLSQYFLLYQNLGWKCSNPNYFVKINDLIYYTNGAIDLKLYFKKAKESYKGHSVGTSFSRDLAYVKEGEQMLYPFNTVN